MLEVLKVLHEVINVNSVVIKLSVKRFANKIKQKKNVLFWNG